MRSLAKVAPWALAGLLAMPAGQARADDGRSVVGVSDLDQALRDRQAARRASRQSLERLLAREDVRALAGEMGLDVRRANAAVATLSDDELERLGSQAAAADAALAGGRDVHIDLVVLLLLVVILILLVK